MAGSGRTVRGSVLRRVGLGPGSPDRDAGSQPSVRSLIPARIDRLPWTRFHTRMVLALGTAWVLDGLEITIAGAVAAVLTEPETLGLTSTQVGAIATVYLLGEVFGALFFGRLSDALGRRNLFVVTLGVYLAGNALTALTWNGGTWGLAFEPGVASPKCSLRNCRHCRTSRA